MGERKTNQEINMALSNQGGGSQTEPPSPSSPPSNAINSLNKNTDSTSTPPPSATSYPTHTPPGAAYPPPYGPYYPPAGYPAGQNPHAYPQGYAAYTNGYPAGYQNHPPAAPYYGPPPTYTTADAVNAGNRFLRSFILCSCIILTFLFLGSILMALMLRPEVPVYKVVSMSVTNFTTNPSLFGEWDTKMTIQNPNEKLKAYFSNFKVDIIYKDGVVSVNYAPGFALNTKEARDMELTGSSTKANESMLDKTTKDEMEKERANGSITITLRVASLNAFETGSFSTRTSQIVAICDGLKLLFPNNSTTGTLDNGGKPVLCNLYI